MSTRFATTIIVVFVSALVLSLPSCAALSSKHRSSGASKKHIIRNEDSNPNYDPVFDTIMRFELKNELLQSAHEFQQLQQEMFRTKALEEEKERENNSNASRKKKRRRRRRRSSNNQDDGNDDVIGTRGGSLLGAQSFATIQVDLLGDKGEEVIALAERLATFNDADARPLYGWKQYGGGNPETCPLNGRWKLRFTSGADATFPDSPNRGRAFTSQIVNATEGTLTNVVDFEKGKLRGLRVVVRGTACSDTEMNLNFRKIILHRNSRFPRFLGRITIPLPSTFRTLSSTYSRLVSLSSRGKTSNTGSSSTTTRPTGPGFEVMYMDSDMRMHKTRDGIWFIHTRLPDVED